MRYIQDQTAHELGGLELMFFNLEGTDLNEIAPTLVDIFATLIKRGSFVSCYYKDHKKLKKLLKENGLPLHLLRNMVVISSGYKPCFRVASRLNYLSSDIASFIENYGNPLTDKESLIRILNVANPFEAHEKIMTLIEIINALEKNNSRNILFPIIFYDSNTEVINYIRSLSSMLSFFPFHPVKLPNLKELENLPPEEKLMALEFTGGDEGTIISPLSTNTELFLKLANYLESATHNYVPEPQPPIVRSHSSVIEDKLTHLLRSLESTPIPGLTNEASPSASLALEHYTALSAPLVSLMPASASLSHHKNVLSESCAPSKPLFSPSVEEKASKVGHRPRTLTFHICNSDLASFTNPSSDRSSSKRLNKRQRNLSFRESVKEKHTSERNPER